MRKLLLSALVAAFGLSAGDARATLVTVTYDLDASVLNLTAPLALPNAADITGTLVATFTGDPGGNIIDGPVTLDSATIALNLGGGSLAIAGLSGVITALLTAPSATSLTGSSLADFGGVFDLTGTVNCAAGGVCDLSLGLPPSTPVSELGVLLPITGATVAPLTAPSVLGATLPIALVLGSTPVAGGITLVGNEVSRSVIPEPGTLLLLASGVAGLASFGRKRAA